MKNNISLESKKEIVRLEMESIWGDWHKFNNHIEIECFLDNHPHVIMYLSRYIRNVTGLWDYPWKPNIIDGVDHSEEHPDQISHYAIEEFRILKNGDTS